MADAQPKQQKAKVAKPQNQKQPDQQANASETKQPKKPKNENKKVDAENKKPEVNNEQVNKENSTKQEKPQTTSSTEEVQAPASTETQTNSNNTTPSNQPNANKNQKPKPPKKEAVTGKGQVKAVPSGDTVVVIHLEKNRPPVERKITFSNIRAPKLGLRTFNEKKEDEDFAWQSREFLRKLAIEKPVSYTIEGTSKDGTRDFGLVHLLDKEGQTKDLAALIVAEGWAEVTGKPEDNNTLIRADVEELIRLEENAKRDNKGIWNKSAKKDKKRPIVEITNIPEVYERLKGHPQHGVVENVLNGHTVIVTITPQFYDVKLNLSGVESPTYAQDGSWEPFAREARFTTEFLLLHRDVQVIFEGADKFNLYGSLNYHGRNISEELLRRGLARYVEWSGAKTSFRDKLKAAEKQAVEHKLGVWSKAQPVAPGKTEDKKGWKPGKEIHGKVVEVVSAGTIVVEDASGTRHRITLSSIKALRGGSLLPSEEKKEEGQSKEKTEKDLQREKRHRAEYLERTYAHEGKEYLRKRIIGQKVRCVLDYSRPPLPSQEESPKQEKKKEEDKLYWSVYFEKNNVAVEVVANGFARATEHRGGDLRSKDYEDILKAENLATKSHRGIHTPDDKAAITYINDATSDATKARKFLTTLKRGKQRGVVEYIAHASRYKLYVPKESCELFINLSGIKTPRNAKEEFFQESLDFVREKLHQRDVEFEVVNVDKGGSFLGTIWFNRENICTLLLSEGYATIIKAVARDSEYFNDYRTAEDTAKRAHKHLWHNYDEVAEKAAAEKRKQEYESNKNSQKEYIDVIVTEIIDATKFYVQVVGKEAEKLEELMKQLAAQETGTDAYKPSFGELVLAQFTADDAWYRAKVVGETPEGEIKVFYIDYGNSETIPKSRVRKLKEEFDLKKLPAQATEARLAYVKPPALNQEYGHEAAEFLKELVEGKTMMANIEFKDGNTLYLNLGDRESQVHVNAAIVRAGLARVERVRGAKDTMAKLKAEEEKARISHNYIWEYGDPGSDEEDEPLRPSAKQAKAPPKKKAEEAKKEGKEEKKEKDEKE